MVNERNNALVCLYWVCMFQAIGSWQGAHGQSTETEHGRMLQPSGQESILHALLRLGQAGSTPIGIIMVNNDILCRTVRDEAAPGTNDIQGRIEGIVSTIGYNAKQYNGTIIVEPNQYPSRLREVMQHRFEKFPQLRGSVLKLSMVLQGWLNVTFDGAKGYSLSVIESAKHDEVTLPAQSNATTEQIATRMTSLGSRGAWILASPTTNNQHTATFFRAYSYKDSDALERVPCRIPEQ